MAYVQTKLYPRKKIVVGSIQYHGGCYECQVDYPFLMRKYADDWIKSHAAVHQQHHVTYYESAAVID